MTFDSNLVSEFGIYTADIIIKTNDPPNKKIVISITMHVVASASPTSSFTSNSPALV
jgi:hypothetical protein